MQIGIDSFAAAENSKSFSGKNNVQSIEKLINRIIKADEVGLDVFGVGEHHRKEFLDSAPHLILAAAAAVQLSFIFNLYAPTFIFLSFLSLCANQPPNQPTNQL